MNWIGSFQVLSSRNAKRHVLHPTDKVPMEGYAKRFSSVEGSICAIYLDALCGLNKARIRTTKNVYADLGYSGEDMKERMAEYGIEIEMVGRKNKKTFEVEPKRWIVERTFAWLGKCRRLSKDYELIADTSLNMIYLS